MTLDLGNTDKLSVFKQDLDRMQVALRQPDLNKSFSTFVVENDGLRYALGALKGVGAQAMRSLVQERRENGDYKSLADFAGRMDYKAMNKRQYEKMAAAGVFDSVNDNRAQVSAAAEIVLRYAQSLAEEKESGQVSLFGGADEETALGMPDLPVVTPWDPLEQLGEEFSAVGFYLTAHPLDSREQQFENLKITNFIQVEAEMENKTAMAYQMAGILLKKQERVSQKGNKFAFLQMSDPTGIYEVMIFSDLLNANRDHLVPGTPLLLNVKAEVSEDQLRFLANSIEPLEGALEHKIRQVIIEIDQPGMAAFIKQKMDEQGSGMSQVIMHAHIDDKRLAKIELPGRWGLDAEARNEIRAQRGVKAIAEA